MIDAVLAIALGLVPVQDNAAAVTIHVPANQLVRNYSKQVDRWGRIHLRGSHPRTGERFHVTISKDGEVEGVVGIHQVNFHASPVG